MSTQRLPRRGFVLLASAATAALVLAGCGSSSAGSESDTINVLFPQTHAGASEILKKEFEAKTGATVNVTLVPYEELLQKATLDVQSGAGTYDVVDQWYVNVGSLAESGAIVPLDDVIEGQDVDVDDFIPSIYDAYSLHDGQRYSLPFDGDAEVLFYNKEILERNGVEPPTTWDEYAAAVQKITEAESSDGVYGAAVMAQKAPIIIVSTYANRLAGFGGTFLDEDGNPKLDTPEAIAAAEALAEVLPHAMPTPSETAFDQALGAFLGGKVAFMEFWTDLGVFAEDESQSDIAGKWGVVQLPAGGDADKSVAALDAGFTMTISSAAPNPELAAEFVAFATSAETNLQLITTTGSGIDANRESTLTSQDYIDFAPEVQKAASASLDGALVWPTSPQSPELVQALADGLAEMVASGADPAETMRAVQKEWESILG